MKGDMDPFVISTIILGIWGALAPLIGIFVGHWLTKSWQRRQWLADNQKEEYRRILAGLNRLNMVLAQQHCDGDVGAQEIKQATEEITIALNTSLFITDFLEKSKVAGDVLNAVRMLSQGGSFDDYQEEYWKAVNLILASAKESKL
jgi:hypothetical protein